MAATAISFSASPLPLLRYSSRRFSPRVSVSATMSSDATTASPSATSATVFPAVIVGGGRVGRMLMSLGSGGDVLVGRGQPVPTEPAGPILVCTRNDDLDAVLDATPASRWSGKRSYQLDPVTPPHFYNHLVFDLKVNNRADLVFFQNGMLEPWFESKGLADANQVLAYFAVSKLGEPPVDGKTDTNPEGLTAAFGNWAPAVAARLHNGGLSCKVLDKEPFQKQMLEKLIWIAAFMLVGARHPGATVGAVEKEYRSEVSSLIAELAAAAAAEKGLTFDEGIEERLCAYSRAVAHFPTAVKEFKWRNGWFYSLTEKAVAQGKPDPCPLHTAWLKELKAVCLFGEAVWNALTAKKGTQDRLWISSGSGVTLHT